MEIHANERPGVQATDHNDRSALSAADVFSGPNSPSPLAPEPERAPVPDDFSTITLVDFKERALRLADLADSDRDGHFSLGDLARLTEKPGITGIDADVLATMYQADSGKSTGGPLAGSNVEAPKMASRADIENLRPPTAEELAAIDALDRAGEWDIFNAADKNHDHNLSAKEVQKSKGYSALVQMEPELEQKLSDGAHVLVIDDIWNAKEDFQNQAYRDVSLLSSVRFYTNHRALATTHALYSDSENPLNSINIDAVHQGLSGDCYFEALLASMAQQRPQDIVDSIVDNHDGTYTVSFPGNKTHPVTVNTPTDAELGMYNGGSAQGLWAPIMEKAFAAYEVQYGIRVTNNLTNFDAIDGGFSFEQIGLLTNDGGRMEWLVRDRLVAERAGDGEEMHMARVSNLVTTLKSALEDKRLVTLSFLKSDAIESLGFVPNHYYSVIGFEEGPDGGNVIIRNPWGNVPSLEGSVTTHGEQKISIEQLMLFGSTVDYQTFLPG